MPGLAVLFQMDPSLLSIQGRYLKALGSVFELAPMKTTTSTIPAAAPGGVVASTDVLLITLMLVARLAPNLTCIPAAKLVPSMVTTVPPAIGPPVGVIRVIVGAR